MGKAIVQTGLDETADIADQWACNSGLIASVKNRSINPDSDQILTYKGKLCSVRFQCQKTEKGSLTTINLLPRLYIFIGLHLALFGGLYYCLSLISELVNDFSLRVFLLGLAAIGVALLIYIKDSLLPAMFSRIENTFWAKLGSIYDTSQQTRATGQIYSKSSRIFSEFLLAGFLISIGFVVLGTIGAIVLCVLVAPLLIMIIAESLRSENPQWHWRFWIMGNMARWTYLMIAIMGIAAMFSAWDIFYAAGVYQENTNISVRESIAKMQFRDIQPPTADALEADTVRIIYAIAIKGTQNHNGGTEEQRVAYRKSYMAFYKISVFVLICIAVFAMVALPFCKLLLSQKIWKNELGSINMLQSPSVPYLSQAWRSKTPWVLQTLMFFHWLFGGIINIAATIFCLDGISYATIGRALLIEKSANAWSILFAHCKFMGGEQWGQIFSTALVFIIALPITIVFLTYIRRIFYSLVLDLRVGAMRARLDKSNNAQLDAIRLFINNACSRIEIKAPVIKFFQHSDAAIFLSHIPLLNITVLKISNSAIELLDTDELNAAIAHELGHVSQGLWKISFLKILSSLALFPNHYLTLCLNWSHKEIKADESALEITGNPNSLKTAIIKMSSAQIACLKSPTNTQTSWFSSTGIIRGIKARWRPVVISARFYWGGSLFGYAHPYLSERLENIDTYLARAKDIQDEYK